MEDFKSLISTRTIIANVPVSEKINIKDLYDNLKLNHKIKNYDCEIVLAYFENKIKGDMSYKKNNKNISFRNAVNIIVSFPSNNLNIKISTNGNFQITGCKKKEHAYQAIEYIITLIKETCPQLITKWTTPITITFKLVMTNVVFSCGYNIDKNKLNKVLREKSEFYNLFETNFGYTGMNIKMLLDKNHERTLYFSTYDYDTNFWNHRSENINPNNTNKKFNTFLVFHSGKIIMSGACEELMLKDYIIFSKFLQDHKDHIIEQIEL